MLIGNSFALANYAWKNYQTECPMCRCGKGEETGERFFCRVVNTMTSDLMKLTH